jgi:hypothetical protein
MAGEFFIELNLFVFSKEAGRINGEVGSEDPISKNEMGFFIMVSIFFGKPVRDFSGPY